MARRFVASAAALVLAALVTPAAGAAGCGPGSIEVIGRILEPPVVPQDGVACCLVRVVLTGSSGSVSEVRARTHPDGSFDACLPCSPIDDSFQLAVAATCCNGSWTRTFDGCLDPLTGQPRVIDMGDLACPNMPSTGMTALTGLVECRAGTLLDPVADCSILLRDGPGNRPLDVTRSRADGTWDTCIPCDPPGNTIVVETQCCGNTQTKTFQDCPEVVATDTVVCNPCPVPPCPSALEVEIVGNVHCSVDADGDGVLDPMPGCSVLLQYQMTTCTGAAPPDEVVTTDGAGNWRTCVRCPAAGDCASWFVVVAPLCCPGLVYTQAVDGCPPSVRVPDLVCPGGPMGCALSCGTGETVVLGTITCTDPASGDQVPMYPCTVAITQSCSTTTIFADTAPDGSYRACVPCPCADVTVTPQCCAGSTTRNLFCGTNNIVNVSCATCPPFPNPCAPETSVSGKVSCIDFATGVYGGLPGCTILIECAAGTGPALTVTTDASGDYEACYPCGTCSVLRVRSCCSGAERLIPNTCEAVRVDFDCGDCPNPRPCPGTDSLQASGRVRCDQPGNPTGLAGCVVVLRALDAAGSLLWEAATTTSGTGGYAACLPCGSGRIASVEAIAECCGARSVTPVTGCPPTVVLDDIACSNCAPCPPGMTRVQGRVRCRGGGPVANCQVGVFIPQCSGPDLLFTTFTDAQGNYRLCVPCPCPGGVVRVTSVCCRATRAVQADACGPIQPIPTLFCDTPCR